MYVDIQEEGGSQRWAHASRGIGKSMILNRPRKGRLCRFKYFESLMMTVVISVPLRSISCWRGELSIVHG